jgi:hypothetical protein
LAFGSTYLFDIEIIMNIFPIIDIVKCKDVMLGAVVDGNNLLGKNQMLKG